MDPNSTPSKEEVFPDPPGKSVHLSADDQIYMELKQRVSSEGLYPGVHVEDTYPVIGHWDHPFQGIAYKAVLLPVGYLIWPP